MGCMPNRRLDEAHMTTRQLLALAQQTREQILVAAHDLSRLTDELRRQIRAIETGRTDDGTTPPETPNEDSP